jgi:hypothetical protein
VTHKLFRSLAIGKVSIACDQFWNSRTVLLTVGVVERDTVEITQPRMGKIKKIALPVGSTSQESHDSGRATCLHTLVKSSCHAASTQCRLVWLWIVTFPPLSHNPSPADELLLLLSFVVPLTLLNTNDNRMRRSHRHPLTSSPIRKTVISTCVHLKGDRGCGWKPVRQF